MTRTSRGATLIELLTVVAIITLLVQLAVPAILAAREAARMSECKNNLRQIGLAAQAHVAAHQHFPTGGWSSAWIGDASRGVGRDQPGGWNFNLLPYLEEHATYDLARNESSAPLVPGAVALESTPLRVYTCPSRRRAIPYPNLKRWEVFNGLDADMHGRSDYAANAGDRFFVPVAYLKRVKSYTEADALEEDNDFSEATGICYARSMIRVSEITDGLSKTYFVGEKAIAKAHYKTGESDGDDGAMFQGHDFDTVRWTAPTIDYVKGGFRIRRDSNAPIRDGQPEQRTITVFGSSHAPGWHAVYCDGSVHVVSYQIDSNAHQAHGDRAGG